MGSTNDVAAELLGAGALSPPALVVTGHQTAGRGQRGRTWFSPPGNLAATFVVPAVRPVQQLPILVGLAVREALAEYLAVVRKDGASAIQLKVKWPNDVLLEGRKLAGILCERKGGVNLIGIGVNVAHQPELIPHELRGSSIALSEVHAGADRWEVLTRIAQSLRARLVQTAPAQAWSWALESWPAHDALLGREIEVATPQKRLAGTALGIDDGGQLLLRTARGSEPVASGTVRVIEG